MKNIAVFASGYGSNLQAIIDNIARGSLAARLAVVVCDRQKAPALKRAKNAGIRALDIDPKGFSAEQDYERHILEHLKKERVEWVVLAGYMRIFSSLFIQKYKNRILNIHPSLLPAFKGRQAIKDAFAYGVKVTGVTVHLVTQDIDSGPIIIQEPVTILEGETLKELEARIHRIEHKIYPEAIQRIMYSHFRIKNHRVRFINAV